MSLLRKRLFKTLLRIGKRFDQNPQFKLFIYSNEIKFGSENIDYYNNCEVHLDDTEKAMKTLIESYCSGDNQTESTAMLYKPNAQSSLSEFIKYHYRYQHFNMLNNNQLDELGLLSIRILFKSLKLGSELISCQDHLVIPQHDDADNKGNDTSNQDKSTNQYRNHNSLSEMKIFHEVSTLQQGVLLVSHPLWLQKPLSHSIMCILSHLSSNEQQTVGFLLNKLYRYKIKDKFKNPTRGSYLQAFKDFPCYFGGPTRFPNGKNLAVIHCIDKLAYISEKIILPIKPNDLNSVSTVMSHDSHIDSDDTTTSFEIDDSDRNTTQQVRYSYSSTNNNNIKSSHTASSSSEVAKSSISKTSLQSHCTQMDGQSSNSISSPTSTTSSSSSYIYVTYDLRAISKALSSGTIQHDDIKIIRGCYIFAEDELQADISNNKYFMVTSDCSKDVIISNLPKQLNSEDHTHFEDPLNWRSGFYTWSKVLRLIGGEYAAFSHIKQIPVLKNANIYYDELNQHPKYGQYLENEEVDDDYPDDYYEDNDDEYEIAQDDDGLVYLAVEDDFDDFDDE